MRKRLLLIVLTLATFASVGATVYKTAVLHSYEQVESEEEDVDAEDDADVQ